MCQELKSASAGNRVPHQLFGDLVKRIVDIGPGRLLKSEGGPGLRNLHLYKPPGNSVPAGAPPCTIF